ncbi:MAG: ATP-dependent helicase [bacterium]
MKESIIADLNVQQQEAVTHSDRPLLILAGAGTGKTKVLVHRIAYLLNNHKVSPYNILALTFTNKAASEMKERVESMNNCHHPDLIISTFHSLCLRVLKWESRNISYLNPGFGIADSKDQQSIVSKLIKQLSLSDNKIKPKSVREAISRYKRAGLLPAEVLPDSASEEDVLKIYLEYQKFLSDSNLLDFDDLILFTNRMFRESAVIRDKYRKRWKHLLIDEYQDTNASQFQLIENLCGPSGANLCVVGDEDQSIYAFRGAELKNILNLDQVYSDLKVVKLEENYRSTVNIISAATEMIGSNRLRLGKKLFTNNAVGSKIVKAVFPNDRDESLFVIRNIVDFHKNNESLDNIAILYRTNDQSRSFEDACRSYGIPYKIIGGLRFYDRKIIKDFLAYLRLLVNRDDRAAFLRIINFPPRGIGKKNLEKIIGYAQENGRNYYEALDSLSMAGGFSQKIKAGTDKFLNIFTHDYTYLNATEFFNQILEESGIKELLENDSSQESTEQMAHLAQLLVSFEYFFKTCSSDNIQETVREFMESITLDSTVEEFDTSKGVLNLMTVHCAKGLEFETVFITGLEEGIFPYQYQNSNDNEEEERRLFYVAMTRSKKRLYLVRARTRSVFGKRQYFRPSKFLDEISGDFSTELLQAP